MISSRWAVASVLGATLVSVALSPDSAASPNGAAPTDQQRQAIVNAFATAFVHDDHVGISANATPDIVWTIPGTSLVSGRMSKVRR